MFNILPPPPFRPKSGSEEAPCNHSWELIDKTYAQPRKDITGLSDVPPEVLEKVLLGTTNYLWECAHCHEHKATWTLGTGESDLEDIFVKVEQFGEQFAKSKSGTVYSIKRYIPPVTDVMSLPMR